MDTIFIVSGASGKLGEAFIDLLKQQGKTVYALSRKDVATHADNFLFADLLKEHEVENALMTVDFRKYKEVVLIHTVGKFKFEGIGTEIIDENGDGIDDEVFDTNVITTKNLLKVLLPLVAENTTVKVCAFASVSDKHDVPFWSSYTRAKNILRGYLQTLYEEQQLFALVVNVSTVDTGNENTLRPNADKTYWLHPNEIAEKIIPELNSLNGYREIDIIKGKPDFEENYYIDHDKLLEKWRREMGH
jgi:short-subunit dehydrogenase